MTSGAYERRICPACGAKGRMTTVSLLLGIPGVAEPPAIAGSRCSKCRCESVGQHIVRRAHRVVGPEEIEARMIVIAQEIRHLEDTIQSRLLDIADFKLVLKALRQQ